MAEPIITKEGDRYFTRKMEVFGMKWIKSEQTLEA